MSQRVVDILKIISSFLYKLCMTNCIQIGSLHRDPYVSSEVGVWVDGGAGHVELLGKVLDLLDERHDGLELLVGLAQRGLELTVGVDQALDLVEGVHDEHVNQVLAGTVKPVVEWLERHVR